MKPSEKKPNNPNSYNNTRPEEFKENEQENKIPKDKIVEISNDNIVEIKPEEFSGGASSFSKIPKNLPVEKTSSNTNIENKENKTIDTFSSPYKQSPEGPQTKNPEANKKEEKSSEETTLTKNINSPQKKHTFEQKNSAKEDLLKKTTKPKEASTPTKKTLKSEIKNVLEPKKEAKKKTSLLKTVRTYQSDVLETMKKQKSSLTSMVVAEKKKKNYQKKEAPKQKQNKWFLPFFVFILFFIGIGGFFAYTKISTPDNTPKKITELKISSIIFPDYIKEIYMSRIKRSNLISKLQEEEEEISIPLGEIIQLYITTKDKSEEFVVENTDGYKILLTTESFFDTLGSKTPASLERSLNSNFIIGFHSSLGNNPFLVFKVNSYKTAFAGMLEWEKTMYKDLSPIFTNKNFLEEGKDLLFKDVVISNKDVRAIFNKNGKIEMAYSFPDTETLIIANNKTTMEEIYRRVTSAQLERSD